MSEFTAALSDTGKRAGAGDPIAVIFNMVNAAKAEHPDFISLAAGPPPSNLLPHEQIVPLTIEAQSAFGDDLYNYTRPQGFPPFCKAMAEFVSRYSVVCNDPMKNMLVLSGGMEGIDYVATALVQPGDTVLVESPSFAGALSDFALLGANVVHVPCDEDGIVPAVLQAAIKEHKPKLVSLMLDFQNPRGWRTPLERRKEIARILQETNTLAVEDGAYAMLGFGKEELPALQSLAPDHVAYVTSVSKDMAPAERLGVVIAPEDFIAVLTNMKSTRSMQASAYLQGLAAVFFSPQHKFLEEHLAQLRAAYAERCEAMTTAIAKHLPEAEVVQPTGGMFIYLKLAGVDCDALLPVAIKDHRVAYVPGSSCYAQENMGTDELRLNFASSTPEQGIEGVRRLAAAVKAFKQK